MKSCENILENCFFFQISSYPCAYVRIIYEKTTGQIPLRFNGENGAPVFTQRHSGHVGVPEHYGGHVGVPNKSFGSKTLFLSDSYVSPFFASY